MENRPARRSSFAFVLFLASSCAATPHPLGSADTGAVETGAQGTASSVSPATELLSPERMTAKAVPPAVATPTAQGGPGATFLRAHVANRMQRFRDQDSDEVAEAILAASRRAEIDPLLILAIIEVESAFDPGARSDRNALGLMQVRPATFWREVERSGLVGDDPHDPELNVAAGALYFQRLVRAFGPNDVALMAYNAGPNRILGLIRAGQIPDHLLEYPRRVRAVEARLRRALAVDSAGTAVARNDFGPDEQVVERAGAAHSDRVRSPGPMPGGRDGP
jgi:soluble lytic murein transglycosylase-like protein